MVKMTKLLQHEAPSGRFSPNPLQPMSELVLALLERMVACWGRTHFSYIPDSIQLSITEWYMLFHKR